jgi:protocatechuate 3,4-dioxygenase beta subunit
MGRRRALERLAMVAGAAALGCGSDAEDEAAPAEERAVSSLDEAPAASATPGAAAPANEGPPQVAALDAPPSWDDVPTCAASNADGAGQGPFFIHDGERGDDIDLFRQDIRGRYDAAAEPGTEMELHVRVLDGSSSDCGGSPVAGIDVYVWHTDAQGYYSGFGEPGDQRPDEPYAGVPNQNDLENPDRFCRGAQVTDQNGVVSFRSIFPGWYNGRDIHVHFLALRRGSEARGRQTYSGGDHLFTTQFYFEPSLSDRIHKASEPYLRRTVLPAYAGSIQADEPGNSGLHAKAEFDGTRVVAQIQILLPSA